MKARSGLANPLLGDWLDLHCGSSDGHEVVLPVLSGSMAPFLVAGGSVRIRPSSWRDCRAGDIVVFREGVRAVAHRCLWRLRAAGRCWLYQKGDCEALGGLIDGRRVVGLVVEAWNADGAVVCRGRSAQTARGELCRQVARDLLARILIVPRALRRLGRRALGP